MRVGDLFIKVFIGFNDLRNLRCFIVIYSFKN